MTRNSNRPKARDRQTELLSTSRKAAVFPCTCCWLLATELHSRHAQGRAFVSFAVKMSGGGGPASRIDEDDVKAYQVDGAVLLKGVFTPEWVERLREGIEYNLAHPSPHFEVLQPEGSKGRFINDYLTWRDNPHYKAFITESGVAELAGRLMRSSKAIFYHEHMLTKEPNAKSVTPWHHDQPYYPVDGNQNVSLWIPVDPVGKDACVQFVRGSHLWDEWYFPRKFATSANYKTSDPSVDTSRYQDVPDIDGDPDRYDVLTYSVEPGDCIAFHFRTIHGAPENSAPTTRRAFAARFMGDDAVFARRPWEISPPVTGGLQPGQSMACAEFPVLWERK